MKFLQTYSVRGKYKTVPIASRTDPVYVQLFDGSFQTGYRITKFIIAPVDVDLTTFVGYAGKIMTVDSGDATFWDYSDNRELAWAAISFDANGIAPNTFSNIDRDNMIIEDCYLYLENSADLDMNYYIEFEKYDISEARGAMTQVRNK